MVGLCHCWEQTDMKSGSYEKKITWMKTIHFIDLIYYSSLCSHQQHCSFIYLFIFVLFYFFGGGVGGGGAP